MAKEKARAPTRKEVAEQNKFIRAFYSDAIVSARGLVSSGKANIYTGFQGTLITVDMLHGGAYAAPINQRPYFMKNPQQSKYYAGDLLNLDQGGGLAGFFAKIGAGQSAADLWRQLMMNSNVPHVLPKLISDEAYGSFMILHAQAATNFNLNEAATGLKTLVEGTIEPLLGRPTLGEGSTQGESIGGGITREGRSFLRAALAAAETAGVALEGVA
jgi:hypothetical protein